MPKKVKQHENRNKKTVAKKMIAARISPKRFIRHNLGIKAPRGWGWLTNPKKHFITEFTIERRLIFFGFKEIV